MDVFATEEFISELKSIVKNSSHKECEKTIVSSISNKTFDELKEGSMRLGGNIDLNPFLRKRIGKDDSGKSGGYRAYIWLFKKEDCIYLLFIHPKSGGRKAGSNLTNEKQKEIVTNFLKDKKDNKLVALSFCSENKKFIFKKKKEKEKEVYAI